MTGIRQEKSDGTILFQDQIQYDENGHITEIRYKDGSKVQYEYDTNYQLNKETYLNPTGTKTRELSYEYDFLGNRTKLIDGSTITSYDYDNANQLVKRGSTDFSYDLVGNLLSDGIKDYQYNSDNELTTVKQGGTSSASYAYNHEGLRTKKATPEKTEYYYYTGKDLTYITDEQNKVRYSFLRNANGQLLSMTDHTGATPVSYSYVTNHRGDIIGLRDQNGTMVITYSYDAYGNQLTATGTTQTGDGKLLREENPFRYASYVYDEETGFYYLQSRYYNPEIGRFITRDNIADSNMYLYTDNNPVNFVDHDGAFPFPVIFLAIRIGIGAYNAYTTYKSIRNDPSASNILLSLVPGGKIGKSASKKLLSAASKAMKKSKGTPKLTKPAAGDNIGKGFTGGISKTIGNTSINKRQVRVDIEYPTGGSTGNVHIQIKGSGGKQKIYLNGPNDINNLEKSLRKNKDIQRWVNKAFEMLERAR